MAIAVLIAAVNRPGATAAESAVLEVAAGDLDRENVVVTAEVPESMRELPGFSLMRLDTARPVPVQLGGAEEPCLVWILRDKLPAGQVRRYRLTPPAGPTPSGGAEVIQSSERLVAKVGGKQVLVYNKALVPSPDPEQPYYARSGYIHPVLNPSGQVVTDDFNPDHMHQHGIMFAWTKSTFKGRPANCWDQKTGQGKVEHVKVEAAGGGAVFGFFTVKLRHVSLNGPDGPEPMLDETWHVRVYRFTGHFLFDLESVQACAGQSPFVVEEYHYGGLMIRGAAAWLEKGHGDFLTSEGKTRADGNHSRPRWCDVHGVLEGRPTGVTVFCGPENYGFPQPVRLHPSMPYFCFTPAVLGQFRVEPERPPYRSRYRFYVHDGKLDPQAAERVWRDFAEPPKVRVVSD
jgi:hypothetical protein